jgi:NAD(P)-dependent dehydrogenase (short-subunit alcohol dehydrogenase family)
VELGSARLRVLEGKSAIITGGGRGIGRAIAEALGRLGAGIVLVARSDDELKQSAAAVSRVGSHAVTVAGSVTDPVTSARMLQACLDTFGSCDILINGAAITGPVGEIESIDPQFWDEMLRINVTGTFLPCRAVLPEMKRQHSGRIVNIASGLAVRAQAGRSAYSASKAAIVQFTSVLAEEVKDHGIYANSVAPGLVRTAMVTDLTGLRGSGLQDAVATRMTAIQDAGGLIEPEESARLFVWLVTAAKRSGEFLRYDDLELRKEIAAFHDALVISRAGERQ